MDEYAAEVVTVSLDCDDWPEEYRKDLARRQLGDLLLAFDDMASETEAEQR